MFKRCASVCLLSWLLVVTGGCGRTVSPQHLLPAGADVPASAYGQIFELTIDTLRDNRFVIDRQDPRFGLIVTRPKIASSALEPWHDDNTTAEHWTESTLNLQRRIVQVRLRPISSVGDTNSSVPGTIGAQTYRLTLSVTIERQHHPPIHLNALTIGRIGRRRPLSLETEKGTEASFWRPVGSDHPYAHRLVEAILERAGLREPDGQTEQPTP